MNSLVGGRAAVLRQFVLWLTAGILIASCVPHPALAGPQMQNLGLRRIASSSAQETLTNQAQLAVDGKRETAWISGNKGEQYLYVDLDLPCRIEQVRVAWGKRPAADYRIEVSMDALDWTAVGPSRKGAEGTETIDFTPVRTRYVRIVSPTPAPPAAPDKPADHPGFAVAELEVYGVCTATRPPQVGQILPRKAKLARQPLPAARPDGRLYLDRGWEMIDEPSAKGTGATIATPRFASRAWYDATVPGTVLTTLVNQGVLPEPLYGLNNRRIEEIYNKKNWWFRESFVLPASYRGKQVWLNFEGINWKADVWLNGVEVGRINGAFTRGRFNVTRHIRLAGPNVVAVRIHCNKTPAVPEEQTQLSGTGQNGGRLGADNPTFHATIGWDWIPGIRDRAIGIWNDVYLSATGPVTVDNPQVVTDLPLPDVSRAHLTVRAVVTNATDRPQKVTLRGAIERTTFAAPVALAPHEKKTVVFTPKTHPQLTLQHPRLWWPNGYGRQDLYDLALSVTDARGQVSDHRTVRFGVREMGYRLSKELVVLVNGQKIMCRGGNWGTDDAMKRLPHKRMDAFVRMHKLANCTMIRNWVGQNTSEDFFDACDRHGILVFNDFWLANPWDGPDPEDPGMFLANARDTVLRYRNHPSIALWCARNEGLAPAAIEKGLMGLLAELDPARRYQRASDDHGVHGRGPYCFQELTEYFSKHARGFTTEIGLPSIPTLDSIRGMMPAVDLWPMNDTWAYHDFCRGAQDSRTFMKAMETRFGAPTGLQDFCRKSALVTYDGYRAVFESWNQKLWKDCSGVLLWMSHPSWPSFVWQLYHHDLEPTPALYGVQKGCEPVHIQMSPVDRQVTIVNNTFRRLPGTRVTVTTYGLDGKKLASHSKTCDAEANAATDCFILRTEALPAAWFARLGLEDRAGRVLSRNFYWCARNLEDLKAMNGMPSVRLEGMAHASRKPAGQVIITTTLHNATSGVAVMAHLTLRRAVSGKRVLPAYASENYISLVPGESRTVTIACDSSDLGAGRPVISLEGWNVKATSIPVQ